MKEKLKKLYNDTKRLNSGKKIQISGQILSRINNKNAL